VHVDANTDAQQNRFLTVAERARAQGFPDEYRLAGDVVQVSMAALVPVTMGPAQSRILLISL
jgi:site-specific DNA-cytosine methylase